MSPFPPKPDLIDTTLWKVRLEYRNARFMSHSHTKLDTQLVGDLLNYIEYLESELEE